MLLVLRINNVTLLPHISLLGFNFGTGSIVGRGDFVNVGGNRKVTTKLMFPRISDNGIHQSICRASNNVVTKMKRR